MSSLAPLSAKEQYDDFEAGPAGLAWRSNVEATPKLEVDGIALYPVVHALTAGSNVDFCQKVSEALEEGARSLLLSGDEAAQPIDGAFWTVERAEVFIALQVDAISEAAATLPEFVERYVEQLQCDYIDMLILQIADHSDVVNLLGAGHWPSLTVKTVGLSNATARQAAIAGDKNLKVSAYCETINPYVGGGDLANYCRLHKIALISHQPFGPKEQGRYRLLEEPAILAIASQHKVNAASLVASWLWQSGVALSGEDEALREVQQLVTLADDEMLAIDGLRQKKQ